MSQPHPSYFSPSLRFQLPDRSATAPWLWSAWAAVGGGLALCAAWLGWHETLQSKRQLIGFALAAATWLALAWPLKRHLADRTWAGASLHHRFGVWSLQNEGSDEELPCEIRVLADMQQALLLRLKVSDSWHWLWLHANSPPHERPNLPATPWLSLRQALVASKALA